MVIENLCKCQVKQTGALVGMQCKYCGGYIDKIITYKTAEGDNILLNNDYMLRNGSIATIYAFVDDKIFGHINNKAMVWWFTGYYKEGDVSEFDIISHYDSGKELSFGRKDDKGKIRYSLMVEGMPKALAKIVEVLEHGAKKYDVHNWQQVDNGIERYKEAFYRHVMNIDGGLFSKDKDSGLLHLAHIACNALFLMELMEKENDKS